MTLEAGDAPGTDLPDKLTAAPMAGDAGFLLAKLHAAGSVLNNRALAGHGLKERSFSVLALAACGLEPTQREMAEFLSLDPSQIVALIDELETRGLVIRAPGRLDRRAKTVSATPEGAVVFRRAEAAARQAEAAALARLSAEEAGQLKNLLRKALWG